MSERPRPWWQSATVYQILSPLVPGQRRRRGGRPEGHPRPPRLSRVAGRGRGLAVADLPLADGRLRLRHQRLLRHPPAVRDRGGLRPAGRGRPRARHAADPRLRAEPHLLRAPLVPGGPLVPGQPEAGLVLLARPRARRRPAQQLALQRRRPGLDLRRGLGPVLLPRLPARAAGPELAQPRGPRGDARRAALLVAQGRGRLPGRRDLAPRQGPGVPRQPAEPGLPRGRRRRRSTASSSSTAPTTRTSSASSPGCAACSRSSRTTGC